MAKFPVKPQLTSVMMFC